jgi:chorismate lyase / 3-hydroxybenzoate synthase
VNQTKADQCVRGPASADPLQTHPRFNNYALRTEYVETARIETLLTNSPCDFLGIVHHERSPGGPNGIGACPIVCLDLPQFIGPPITEVWTSMQPVTCHQADGIHCAMNDEVLFGAIQIEEPIGTRLDVVTYNLYLRLLVQARALGFMHLLRVWNYIPHINRESDGQERYQQFCVGRHRALAESLSDFPRSLPAATAVGTRSGPLNLYFLAAKQPGTHIENPRQVHAYEYPTSYGPSSPSFARATLQSSSTASHLLISGTASVVGHRSVHIGEPYKQIVEIIHNLKALIGHTERLHRGTRGQWNRGVVFKIYIRQPEHFATIRYIFQEHLPSNAQVLYLQGEMCRSELLAEVEGVLSQEKPQDVSRIVLPISNSLRRSSTSRHAKPDHIRIV